MMLPKDIVTGIPFTQYLRPYGAQRDVFIDMPPDVEAKAQALIAQGYRFDIEILTTGMVSMTCEWSSSCRQCSTTCGNCDS
jgi:hypothetical protein